LYRWSVGAARVRLVNGLFRAGPTGSGWLALQTFEFLYFARGRVEKAGTFRTGGQFSTVRLNVSTPKKAKGG